MNKHKTFNTDIVNLVGETVRTLAKEQWQDDACPPEFWVSLNNEDMENQSIMMTIHHNGYKFTERLFPRKGTEYGYGILLDQMINMYNQTM